jgi:nucleoside-diphosphate-sugar epimerase
MDIQTVAVFGAGGKLGRRVLGVLRQRGLKVRALVHRTPIEGENITSVSGSISDISAVRETIRGADAVVHLATTKEDPDTFFDVALRGTWNILEACRAGCNSDKQIQQVILFGGDAAQGIWFFPQPIPIDENHALMAYPGYYAFSKVMEENMAQQYSYQYGVPFSILRSSWVFQDDDLLQHFSLLENVRPAEPGHGFGEVPNSVMQLVKAGKERIPILTNEDGVALNRHIVHVDDVMQAFDKMLGNDAAINTSFNIAAPAAFNYRVAANYLSEKTGIETIEIPCKYFGFEININRARSVLGYAPENDFFKIADRALEFRKEKN